MTANSVTVGELWDDTNKTFNGGNLTKLYEYLTGTTGAKYSDANNLISGSTTALNATAIRTKAGNKNITVTFGGMDWTVTYLTRTRTQSGAASVSGNTLTNQIANSNGDLIVDLWLADVDGTPTAYTDGWYSTAANMSWATPANLYGSSYIRSIVLNAGGFYTSYNGTTATVSAAGNLKTQTVAKDASNKYAKFTMTQAELAAAGSSLTSLTDYIVSPINVSYQETICSRQVGYTSGINYNNTCYGTPSISAKDEGYWAKAHHADWKIDYIWLPAIEEGGASNGTNSGFWKTDLDQQKAATNYWFRTGRNDASSGVSGLAAGNGVFVGTANKGGTSWTTARVDNKYGVRPALHLNLSKAAAATLEKPSAPTTASYNYTGVEQTIDLTTFQNFDASKMYVTNIARNNDGASNAVAPSVDAATPADTATKVKLTSAGTYTVTLKAKKGTINGVTNSQYHWRETTATTDPTETTIEFTVNKAKIENPGMGTKTATYSGEDITFTATNYVPTSITSTPLPTNHLQVSVARTEGGSGATVTPTSTRGVDITVRNAGTYKATFTITDTTNYEWKDATSAKELTFTVEKKKLLLTYTTDDPSNSTLSWSADDTTTATFTISGIYAGDATNAIPADSVSLQAKITQDEDSTFSVTKPLTDNGDGTQEFVLDVSLFGGAKYIPGHYPITFEFTGGTQDSNYDLTTVVNTMSNEKFVVGASGAGLGRYDWKYSADGGALTPMPAAGTNLVYAYNATAGKSVEYKLIVDESNFAAAFIEIDTSKYTNGYDNNVKDRAGTYTTKVALKVTDPNYMFKLSDGTESPTMDVTYTWTIDKATLDPSTINWQYTDASGQTQIYDPTSDGIPWKGTNYTLTLTGLPAGVTVNPGSSYSGNQAKAVGTYTATCTSLSYDTNNYNTIASPTLNWAIKAQEIEINNTSWIMDANSSSSGVFYLPHLNSPYDGSGIVYEYYHLGTDADPISPANKLNDVSEITVELGTPHYYYVKAVLANGKSTDGVTDWQDALVLNDTTAQPNGACTIAFQTGDNRTPVSVTLNGNPVMYDGKEHGKLNEDLFIRVGSTDMSASDFHVDYYEYDDTQPNNKGAAITTPAPVNAGKYLIVVSLSSAAEADYFLHATTFDFEILPYEIDMSGVRWGYLDEDGNEVVYNAMMPPMFTLNEDGTPKEIRMQLVGFPKGDENGTDEEQLAYAMFAESGLENLIVYTGNAYSGVGTYTAKYTLDETQLSSNFKLVSMPDPDSELKSEQGWKIAVREIEGPQNNNTAVFSGEPYDLLELAGLRGEDLGLYFEIGATGFITMDENNEPVVLNPSDVHSIVNAGVYRITLTLKDPTGENVKWLVNGSQRTSAQVVTITINKLVVTVSDWEGEEGNQTEPWKPVYNNGVSENQPPMGLIENEIKDSKGEIVEGTSWNTRWNETFKQRLKPTAGNENNIEIVYADGVDEEKSFTVGDDPSALPATAITRPTFTGTTTEDGKKEEVFAGTEFDFTPQGLQDLVDRNRVKLYAVDASGSETEVDIGYFKQRNAGSYKVIVRINGNYKWSDTNDKSDAVYEFNVKKAELTGTWETDESGMPILKLAEGTPEAIANMLVYEYKDADGNVVPSDKLTKGKEYTVVVKVADGEKGNVTLLTEDGEETESLESTFTVPGRNTLANMLGLPEDFPLIQVVLTILFTLLFIIFLIMWIKYRKERKASKEIIEQYEDLNV